MIKILESIKKKEESLNKENDLIKALHDMENAMEHVLDLWDEGPDGLNRECLDNGDYPFDKSFNEIVTDVNIWVRQCNGIYLSGNEV